MSTSLGTAVLELGTDDALLVKGLKKAESRMAGFAKSAKRVGVALSAIGAIGAVALKSFISSAQEQQIGISRLDQALQNVGVSYEGVTGQIETAIEALQQKTNFGDEAQRDALVELISVTGSYEDSLKALPTVLDLAAGKNMDLGAASTLVARALGGETSALTRYGIELDKEATATEVMAAIMAKFGGQAEAAADPLTQMRNRMGDVAQIIGDALLPFVEKAATFIELMMRKLQNMNPAVLKAVAIIGALVTMLGLIAGPALLLIGFLPQIAVGLKVLRVAMLAVGKASRAMLGPIGLIITIVGLLGTAFATNMFGIRDKTVAAFNFIRDHIATVLKVILNVWTFQFKVMAKVVDFVIKSAVGIINGFVDKANKVLGFLKMPQIPGLEEVEFSFEDTFDSIKDKVTGALDSIGRKGGEAMGAVKDSAEAAEDGIGGLNQELKKSAELYEKLLKEAKADEEQRARELQSTLESMKKRREIAEANLRVDIQRMSDFGGAVIEALKRQSEAARDAILDSLDRQSDAAEQAQQRITKSIKAQIERSKDLFRERSDAAKRSYDKELDALRSRHDKTMAIFDRELRARLDALGKTTNAQTSALRADLQGLDKERKALDRQERAREDTARERELTSSLIRAQEEEDADAIGRAEKALDEFRRRLALRREREAITAREQELRSQIRQIETEADIQADQLKAEFVRNKQAALEQKKLQEKALADRLEATKSHLKDQAVAEQLQLEERRERAEADGALRLQALEDQREAAVAHFESLTAEEALQSEARRLILSKNQGELIDLLESFNPKWQDAGQSFGEKLLEGLNSQKTKIETAMRDILGLVSQTGVVPTVGQQTSGALAKPSSAGIGSTTSGRAALFAELRALQEGGLQTSELFRASEITDAINAMRGLGEGGIVTSPPLGGLGGGVTNIFNGDVFGMDDFEERINQISLDHARRGGISQFQVGT